MQARRRHLCCCHATLQLINSARPPSRERVSSHHTASGANRTSSYATAAAATRDRSLRFELRVGEAVSRSYSPAVEWQFETAGWLVVGFEHGPIGPAVSR